MDNSRVRHILNKINDLPTLPGIVLRLTELINDPRSSARDLERIISTDQTQTARLLKLVNSAMYGFPRKISSIREAVAILGFNAVKNLCLSVSIFDLFSKTQDGATFSRKALWEHSLGCAVGAKVLASHIGHLEPEELFTAGLLHDIGKVILDKFIHDEFQQIARLVREKNILMIEAEKEILDITHTEVGQILASQWKLPFKLQDSIAFHHTPHKSARSEKEIAITHLADVLCRALSIGSGGDNRIPPVNKKAWTNLKLTSQSLKPIMKSLGQEYTGVSSVLTD